MNLSKCSVNVDECPPAYVIVMGPRSHRVRDRSRESEWIRPSRTTSSTSRAPSSATGPGSGAGLRRPVPSLQDYSGVEDAARIQRILDPCGHRHHISTDLIGQPRCLETTDAVLTGDRSAELDRSAHDVAEGTTRASFCVAVAGRVDDHRVDVAVAGMRNDGDEAVVGSRYRLDALHQGGQRRNRHADVVDEERTEGLERR